MIQKAVFGGRLCMAATCMWVPHELWRRHPDGREEQLFQEVYHSKALLEEDAKIQAIPRRPGEENIEHCPYPISLYSDSTRVANFGNIGLWPIYQYPGTLSKYIRDKPSSFAAHHVAYMPKASFSSFISLCVALMLL